MSFMDRFGFSEGSFTAVSLTPLVRAAVLQAWHDKCAYCEGSAAEHVDHIIPAAKGGPDCLENFTAACARCNLRKTDLILPEGLLGILLAKARTKAPKIERQIAARARPARSTQADRSELAEELERLWKEEGAADAPALDLQQATLTELKREMSRARARIKANRKAMEMDLAIADLVARRAEGASCPTIALLLTERDRRQGALRSLAQVRAATKRAEKGTSRRGTTPDWIDLAMPHEVRRELLALLEKSDTSGGWEKVRCTRVESPSLFAHLQNCVRGPSAQIAGWRMNLISGWSTRGDEGEMTLNGPVLEALRRAEALGVSAFEFKNPFGLKMPPPVSHCRPKDGSAI
jgi:hypothetical protein